NSVVYSTSNVIGAACAASTDHTSRSENAVATIFIRPPHRRNLPHARIFKRQTQWRTKSAICASDFVLPRRQRHQLAAPFTFILMAVTLSTGPVTNKILLFRPANVLLVAPLPVGIFRML